MTHPLPVGTWIRYPVSGRLVIDAIEYVRPAPEHNPHRAACRYLTSGGAEVLSTMVLEARLPLAQPTPPVPAPSWEQIDEARRLSEALRDQA